MDDSIKKPEQKQTCPHCREEYTFREEFLYNHICEGVINELIDRKKILEKEEALQPDKDYSADWFDFWQRFKALERKANASYSEARYNFYIKREETKQKAGGSFFPWQDQKDIGE